MHEQVRVVVYEHFLLWSISLFEPPGPTRCGRAKELPILWREASPKTPGVRRTNSYGSLPNCGSVKISCELRHPEGRPSRLFRLDNSALSDRLLESTGPRQ